MSPTQEAAEAAAAGASAAGNAAQAASVATDSVALPLAAESAPPDSAPAELAPAEAAAASETALAQSQPALGEGRPPSALVERGLSLGQGGAQLAKRGSRSGGIGLLPQLKTRLKPWRIKSLS